MPLPQESPIPGVDPIEMLSPKDTDKNFRAAPLTIAPRQNKRHGHQWEKSKSTMVSPSNCLWATTVNQLLLRATRKESHRSVSPTWKSTALCFFLYICYISIHGLFKEMQKSKVNGSESSFISSYFSRAVFSLCWTRRRISILPETTSSKGRLSRPPNLIMSEDLILSL